MFIKPYRTHLRERGGMPPSDWVQRDIDMAPPKLVESLREHYSRFDAKIIPVINATISISFQYADSDEYIFRELGYSSIIIKTLLDLKITGGFINKIDSIVNRLSSIDNFIDVENDGLFCEISDRQTYIRSIVVGLNKGAECISDIDYIEFCYDNKPNAIPFLMPIENLFPTRTKRTGVKLKLSDFKKSIVKRTGVKIRLYLKKTPASYKIKKESVNCIYDSSFLDKVSFLGTIKSGKNSDYSLVSTEHHLSAYHDDVDGLVLKFLKINQKRLSQKLGYTVTKVDKSILNVIDMTLF